jgi:hypothetical protein
MPALPDDRCPRCGASFHCGMGDAAPCACAGVVLDAAAQAGLRERYVGCLCLDCLRTLAAGAQATASHPTHPPPC